ncbi:type II toxin-antitoxin system VapB family antitoxin [Jatrophihabitans endophyticus]|uniref:type II toxin-antitoxin system VapB family antitoxin n=1 Tax=Jatrophihabitans endophyticus TaxID=1206085 RepID=UPI0019DB1211|nr:type II toxin-antitoxin system VapB family antitoxin [Jatrophihabitans endophyticus]MBE7190324.1 type II toxin-antitoxin system VapB family antitoxin [Jatrophihabitans endophyticus]
MSRTNIDLDDDAVADVMARFGFKTKRDAVNYALRALHVEPLTREQMLDLEGVGWDGDLDAMRGRSATAAQAS